MLIGTLGAKTINPFLDVGIQKVKKGVTVPPDLVKNSSDAIYSLYVAFH